MFLLKSQDYLKFINGIKKWGICNASNCKAPLINTKVMMTIKGVSLETAGTAGASWPLHEFLLVQSLSGGSPGSWMVEYKFRKDLWNCFGRNEHRRNERCAVYHKEMAKRLDNVIWATDRESARNLQKEKEMKEHYNWQKFLKQRSFYHDSMYPSTYNLSPLW